MEIRMQNRLQRRKKKRNDLIFSIVIWCIAILSFWISVILWFYIFNNTELDEVIYYFNLFYGMAVCYFLIVGATDNLFSFMMRSIIKLLFNVWIFAFIILLTIDEVQKNLYIVFFALFIGYLEVLFDLNDVITKSIERVKIWKLKFVCREKMISSNIPITIIMMSLIHGILALLFKDVFVKLIESFIGM